MLIRLLLTLLLLSPELALAKATTEDIQAVRVEAFSLCSNLLVYYNPNKDGGDQKHLDRYRQSRDKLQKLLLSTQDPELQAAGKGLLVKVADLERQPSSNAQLHPTWINPLLEAQARLDQVANLRYAAAPPQDPFTQSLYRQSLDVQTFLLLYETRTFGSLAVYIVNENEVTFPELDQAIVRRFAQLQTLNPQHAEAIGTLKQSYDFVRPRLLQYDLQWVPSSAAYYLGKIVKELGRVSDESQRL